MKKRRLSLHTLLPGLSLVFTLFVFAPADLYMSSAEEFWFTPLHLVRWLLIFALAAFAVISLLAVFLPPKLSVAFRAAVYACSFLAWLQGNLLLQDYGALDGRYIDWSAYTVRYLLDALLWIAVIALFIFLMFRFRKKFRTFLEIAACVLLVTQAVSIAVFLARYAGQERKAADRYLSCENEFTVSSGANTAVFVLDTFDSHLFENVRQEYPELVADSFEDFTFYPDTVGGATRTKYAIPFILTGGINREERSYPAYLSAAFGESPLIRELATGQYDSGFYTVSHYLDMSRDDAIGNITAGDPVPSSKRKLTQQFMKLVAFRYAPSVFSRFFWFYTGDFEFWKNTVGAGAAYRLYDPGFYQQMAGSGLRASAPRPAFRFYHLNGVHEPYSMDENSMYSEVKTDETRQALGSLNIVTQYMARLKELGVYDNATVIVLADHGYGRWSKVEQTPLLMVKTAGASHPFEVSDLPLSYVSLPDIMVSALRGTLVSLEPWRASSTRYFYRKTEKDNVTNITEYAVDGPAWDAPPKKTGAVFHEDTLHRTSDYTPGTVLYFDERDTARGYVVSGFSGNEGVHTWTSANDAEMLFTLPDVPGALKLELDHGTYNGTQTVEVWVNGSLVNTYTAAGSGKHSVLIPAGTVTGTELRLRFHLPDACSPESLGRSIDKRLLALSMQSLAIRDYNP